MLLGAALSTFAFGQGKSGRELDGTAESLRDFREDIRMQKQGALRPAARADAGPADFAELDSFGKNVMFLGSLYAGTVYIEPDCTPAPPLPPLVLASDDHCVEKSPGAILGSTAIFDPAWRVTIPGKTVKNVIYLLLNNSVTSDSFNPGPGNGVGGITYTPQVTLISEALNDPTALIPGTNTQMNGQFTTALPGQILRRHGLAPAQSELDLQSYGSVNGRGFSRSYFRALGLSETIIDNIFKKDLTLQFGIRFSAPQSTESATLFYQFRILGQ
jgi:hypothetical protein